LTITQKKNDILNFFGAILISCISFVGLFVPVAIGFIEKRGADKYKKLTLYAVSILTVMFKFSLGTGVFYAISVLLLLMANEVLDALDIKSVKFTKNMIFCVTFFSNVLCEVFDGFLAYDLFFALIAAISATMSYALFENMDFNIYEIDEKGFLILSAFIGILLITLKDFSIYSLSLKNMLAIYIILNLAFFKGAKFAVIGGLIIGTIGEISETNMGVLIISLTLGGLISSIFRGKGKIATVCGFLVGNSILAYYITGYNTLTSKFLEIVLAGICFTLTSSQIKKVTEFIVDDVLLLSSGEKNNEKYYKNLDDTTNMLNNITNVIEGFKTTKNERKDIFDMIQEKVCNKCENCTKCWNDNYSNTMDAIFSCVEEVSVKGNVAVTYLDKVSDFEICNNKVKIINEINEKYNLYKNEKNVISFDDLKKCMVNQIKGISKYISGIATRTKEDSLKNIEEKIIKGFEKINLPIEKAYVNMADNECEVQLKANKNILQRNIIKSNVVLSEILNKRMVSVNEKGCNFKETEKFKVEVGFVSKSADGQEISGDTYKLIDFLEDKYIMVLSDGMGVGAEAKYISNMLVDMFSDMSKNNIDTETITTLISSFAQYISESEKIITLDSTSVNLVTGECEIIKIGGAPTFIIKKDCIDIICSGTLPMGIFEEVDFYKETRCLEPGDIVVSVTDGVIDSKRDIINKEFWVSGFLKNLCIDEPQIIAEELLNKTIENYNGKISDDITIIVQKIV